MSFLLLKYFIPVLGVAAVALAWEKRRRREMSTRFFGIWVLLWVGLALVVQLPQKTDVLARLLGVGRGVDVLLFLAIIGIFFLQFRFYLRLERIERDITKLVREIALREKKP